jgi:ankyrin repeat protein
LSRAAERGDEKVVKLLLENGAVPYFEDEHGQTPLSRAVEGGSVAVVQLLLANKEVKMDYTYNIVSESHPCLNESLPDRWLILFSDYCSL